jgi:hypothetical protein
MKCIRTSRLSISNSLSLELSFSGIPTGSTDAGCLAIPQVAMGIELTPERS